MTKKETRRDDSVLIFDLFAGAGGVGYHLAKHWRVLGFDNWDVAVETSRYNGLKMAKVDLKTINWEAVVKKVGASPQVVWGSPPCQPFSHAGGGGNGEADERDGMPYFFRAIEELRPKLFIMENVPGITHSTHRLTLEAHERDLRRMGYKFDWALIDCSHFGIPQSRERFIWIGRHKGVTRWPKKVDFAPSLQEGLRWSDKEVKKRRSGPGSLEWVELDPAPTIVGTFDPHILKGPGWRTDKDKKSDEERPANVRITLEEAAFLQGFPKWWNFLGSNAQQWQMIGNAFPGQVAVRLLRANLDALR